MENKDIINSTILVIYPKKTFEMPAIDVRKKYNFECLKELAWYIEKGDFISEPQEDGTVAKIFFDYALD